MKDRYEFLNVVCPAIKRLSGDTDALSMNLQFLNDMVVGIKISGCQEVFFTSMKDALMRRVQLDNSQWREVEALINYIDAEVCTDGAKN